MPYVNELVSKIIDEKATKPTKVKVETDVEKTEVAP